VVTDYSFTLNRLKHPSDEEKAVLAIICAAATTLTQPGDPIRAVGVSRGELADGRIALAAGFLPVEAPLQGSEDPFARY
jgi:hypothetical protein